MTLKHQSKCPFALLLYLIIQYITQASANLTHIHLVFNPPAISDLKDNKVQIVNVTYLQEQFPVHNKTFDGKSAVNLEDYQLRCASSDNGVAEVEMLPNSDRVYDLSVSSEPMITQSFLVRGRFIGKISVACELQRPLDNRNADPGGDTKVEGYKFEEELSVWVNQSSVIMNKVFVGTLIVLVMIANCMLGCDLHLQVVKETLKRPVAPIIGFVCQFLLMPLISFSIAYAVLFPSGMYTLGLGLFTTGCSPGGGASNYWTLLMNGNTDLSITMTFISTVAALVMMPLWMSLLGRQFLVGHANTQLRVPYGNIGKSLLGLVLPLIIGVAIRHYKPKWAECTRKVMRPFVIFILVFIIGFGSYANWYMFYLMAPRVLLAGLLLPWCGFMFGCFAALATRQAAADVSAIAIETGIQNTGVAIMLLKMSFEQPDADLSSVVPVVCSIFTPLPLLFAVFLHKFLIKQQSSASSVSSNDVEAHKQRELVEIEADKEHEQQRHSLLEDKEEVITNNGHVSIASHS